MKSSVNIWTKKKIICGCQQQKSVSFPQNITLKDQFKANARGNETGRG